MLLSAKAGLRAGEIANLTWDMVVDANGQISGLIELADAAAKKCSGRSIPIHPDLAAALDAWRQVAPTSDYVIASERGGRMTAAEHRRVVQPGVQEHWPERLLVAFRPQDVRHPGRPHRAQGRRLAAGRAIVGRPSVDPDDAAVHRRRQRRAAQARCDDLRAMVATDTIRHRHTNRRNHLKTAKPSAAAIEHAVRIIHAICGLAGSATLIDDIRADLRADKVRAAIRNRDTAVVFDWLMAALSYQGISDQAAYDYMERHGRAEWRDIDQKLGQGVSCPKLKSYWHFHGCRYEKASRTCAEPEHIGACPLPSHDLRNGHLNQTAYSLFLFIRDIADGDLIGWIDGQLAAANGPPGPHRLTRMAAALIEPMREMYGVSDKVLAMALSSLLLGAPEKMVLWTEVGGSMIAIDTLVHNFLHRTGILARFNANHSVWLGLLPAGWLRRHHSSRRRADRCPAVQSDVSADLSPLRPARDLAVLRPEWARCLQRQSYRRRETLQQSGLPSSADV